MQNIAERIPSDLIETWNRLRTASRLQEYRENSPFSQLCLDGKNEIEFVCLRVRDECTKHEIETMAYIGLSVEFGTVSILLMVSEVETAIFQKHCNDIQ
jgi:hypothetical protein